MTIAEMGTIAGALWIFVMPAWFIVSLYHPRAVPGSHVRYVLASWGIILSVALAALDSFRAFADLMPGKHLYAGMWTVQALWVLFLSKRFFQDDNWFNNQFKRLKRGLKNLQSRLIYLASPSPATA